jgi:hypothetical protein
VATATATAFPGVGPGYVVLPHFLEDTMPSVERTTTVTTPSPRVRHHRVELTDTAAGDPLAGYPTAPSR